MTKEEAKEATKHNYKTYKLAFIQGYETGEYNQKSVCTNNISMIIEQAMNDGMLDTGNIEALKLYIQNRL